MGCKPSNMNEKGSPGNEDVNKEVQEPASLISIRSAIIIQNWYRGYLARHDARRQRSWMIYQTIEYSGEQDQLKLHNLFMDLLTLVGQQKVDDNVLFTEALNKSQMIKRSSTYLNDIEVEMEYSGPVITFPVSLKVITSLVHAFSDNQVLHPFYLFDLLVHTKALLKSKPNILKADLSISKQITVCGDLHGQLHDLLYIFEENHYPDPSNPYVFNGDFVDRGKYSVEVAVVLFCFFLLYPGSVFINRGNHEDRVLNMRYGFIKEVQLKYKENANTLLNLFSDVFSWLPLATIISEKIFICHGGISNKVKIEDLEQVERSNYISILKCPSQEISDQRVWLQILDILWSDPKNQKGCHPNKFRGGGSYFGPDTTREFLQKNNFKLLIRSHECKLEGFEWSHNKQILTIFSASSYYDEGSNKGAYIKIDKNLDPKIFSFSASKEFQKRIGIGNNVRRVEVSAMRELRKKILASHLELMRAFQIHDEQHSGSINSIKWAEVMREVLGLELPWNTLRNQLAKTDEKGAVIYASTFDLLMNQIHDLPTNKFSVTEELYKYRDTLETVFRILDSDNSGKISLEEFKEGCLILRKHSASQLTSDAMEDLAKSLDINKDGSIDLNEFMEAFRLNEEFFK